jgi:beta-1,4-mannosyl-glycoprotein beta-1,4-N-acetylglucosaminyltransferase
MKIYDCFIYFNEDLLLDLRFNFLNKYVDKFVIVESTYTHSGKKRKLLFDINNFSKFKDKITYLVLDYEPNNLFIVDEKKTHKIKLIQN